MRLVASTLAIALFIGCGGSGGVPSAPPVPTAPTPMCVMKGVAPPPVKYALVKPLKLGRQTYGGVRPLTVKMVEQARQAYADAIFNYNGSQRFGFWPWRFIRPVVTGDAVRIDHPEAFDCVKLGGEFYSEAGYLGPDPAIRGGESEYDRGRREERERIEREQSGGR
jgi:hypothetical protein